MTRGAQMPDVRDLLAAEHALGLLDEDAWLEAERQLASDTLFRAEYQHGLLSNRFLRAAIFSNG